MVGDDNHLDAAIGGDFLAYSKARMPLSTSLSLTLDQIFVAGCHLTEMRGWNVFLHDLLEVEDVERLLGVGNQLAEIARRPIYRVRWTQALRQGGSRQRRARYQELPQTAAARRMDGM